MNAFLHRQLMIGGAFTALFAISTDVASAARYVFDQRHTEVRFVYKMAGTTQRGRFTKISGSLDYDAQAPRMSKLDTTIDATSLSTGEVIIDASPVIAFKSLKVKLLSATSADVAGEVTVNGITKPTNLKVTLQPHDDPALKYDTGAQKFTATTRIKRSAFNMNGWEALVDDSVEIEIDAVVRPAKPTP